MSARARRSSEPPLAFRAPPPAPLPMPISHFLARPRREAAARSNEAIAISAKLDKNTKKNGRVFNEVTNMYH